MPVKRKTIDLEVISNALAATDAATGLETTDAGLQGEDGAVWLCIVVPPDWSDLSVRLQVTASNGECDESGLPQAGVINMPLRGSVTVPGRLTATLTGTGADGVRRTAQCDTFLSRRRTARRTRFHRFIRWLLKTSATRWKTT